MDFNSLDWGYIMDVAIATVVGALIAVAGSIIVNWFGNRKGYKDVNSKIGTLDNTTLSGQHNKITEDIIRTVDSNSKEINKKIDDKIGTLDNTTLSGQNNDIIKRVDNISQFLMKERELKIQRNSVLSYDVQKISSSIENLSEFTEIMKNLSSENSELKAENHKILIENKSLTQENAELKRQLAQCQTPANSNSFTQGTNL